MDRRLRPAAMVAACVCTLTFAATAYAYVTTDMNNFNLTESVTTWPTQFHVATGTDGWISWRWLDTPNKATVISVNRCSDLALFNLSNYGVNDTSYHAIFQGSAGMCFMVRGRTAAGQGSMVNHDGRVQR
jgi:hypothetical protein